MKGKERIGGKHSGMGIFLLLVVCGIGIVFPSCGKAEGRKRAPENIASVTTEVIAPARTDAEKIERLFLYVRDKILFNWVYPQNIPPEEILKNGFGVCMQKAHLLSAMAREAGLRTRFRFLFVRKQALEDFLPAYAYKKWADPFPHTVVEIFHQGRWRSFDPSFDQALYELCLAKKINFARYPEIVDAYKTVFSIDGMKGTQEYWAVREKDVFYGDALDPLMEWDKKNVSLFKRAMKPLIFRQARGIMDKLRE